MNRILELDPANRHAVVRSGVINAWVSRAAKPHGLHHVPGSSSQIARSIGGTWPRIPAAGNRGCILRIREALREQGSSIRVMHTADFLAEAYTEGEADQG